MYLVWLDPPSTRAEVADTILGPVAREAAVGSIRCA